MEVSNNIEILKEEFRKKELTSEVLCAKVLLISRAIFDRLKTAFNGHKILRLMIEK